MVVVNMPFEYCADFEKKRKMISWLHDTKLIVEPGDMFALVCLGGQNDRDEDAAPHVEEWYEEELERDLL